MEEKLVEEAKPLQIIGKDVTGSKLSLAMSMDVSAPEPQRAQHAFYRSLIDVVPSYNPIE